MQFHLSAEPSFYESLDHLEDSDAVAAIAETMILRVMQGPLRAKKVGRTRVRVIRAGASRQPALRLFYTAEEGVITLLRLEED